ncbi:hypothetical protein DFJ58DRAFT_644462, partial [Suillus subalutaceus]|uniref:uncharacterized protein n=1 Tax=Suillus subalutaceus TaxID=48586 RepID=UPI001B86C017
RPKVHLSKEARALLTTQRRQKSQGFRTALHEAWLHLDESMKTIASSHHKSIRRVQNDLYVGHTALRFKRTKSSPWNAFCWKKHQQVTDENLRSGKAVLQDLLHNYADEYHELSQEDKDQLIKEYDENREHKTKGKRISLRSKINDIMQTLRAVETELIKLQCRTGVESIVYSTRGSTDLALRGITFNTEGVDNFMESTMNIDSQDLMSKMEGYAMQGNLDISTSNTYDLMAGAAKSHQDCCSKARGETRHIINQKLQEITGNPQATMQWTEYWRNIVQRYHIVCEGWPSTVPFKNLSEASSSLPELKMLQDKWESGAIKWKHLEEEEYQQLLQERLQNIDNGEIIERTRRQRSDKGKKCTQPSDNPSTHKKKAYKSADTVES